MKHEIASVAALALLTLSACNKTETSSTCEPTDKCSGSTSTLVVSISAPPGVTPLVTVAGPLGTAQHLTSSDSLKGTATGTYAVSASRVKVAGSIVGKAYYAVISEPRPTVNSCSTKTVTVTYQQEPGSEKLWVLSDKILAFGAAKLAAAGTTTPDVSLETPAGARGIAFDSSGNLWFSNGEGVFMYAMKDLGNSNATPAVKLTGSGVSGTAIPGAGALAFDEKGCLWVAQIADNKVVRFTPDQISATGTPTPAVVLSGSEIVSPRSLAFDIDGNLWVSSGGANAVLKYARSRLASSQTSAPDVEIVHRTPPPVVNVLSAPSNLAFDKDGNLEVVFFDAADVVRIPKTRLAISDTLEPDVSVEVGVLSLPEGLALDEAGGGWLPGKADEVLHLTVDGLGKSGPANPAGILIGLNKGYASEMAFNPSSESLPLHD